MTSSRFRHSTLGHHPLVVIQGEAPLGLRAGHGTHGPAALAREAFRVAHAADDLRPLLQPSGNDAHLALVRTDGTLTSHKDELALAPFARYLVVVAIDGLQPAQKRPTFTGLVYRPKGLFHHHAATEPPKVLRAFNRSGVVIELLRAL